MDRTAIERLVAEPRIMVLTVNRNGKEPLVAPVWYEYADGRVRIWTDYPVAKTRLIERNPAVTLCVQSETPPYKAVLIRGAATVTPGRDNALGRRIAQRYLGDAEGTAYVDRSIAGTPAERQGTIVVTPHAWRAWDYAESNGDAVAWTPDTDLR